MKEHGRLLTLKQQLLEQLDDDVLEESLLCLFQLKEFEPLKSTTDLDETLSNLNSHDAIKAMDLRQSNMIFVDFKMIQCGAQTIEKYFDLIRDSLLAKDGIVGANEKSDFHNTIKEIFSDEGKEKMHNDYLISQIEPPTY